MMSYIMKDVFKVLLLYLFLHVHKVSKIGWVHAILDCPVAILQQALLLFTTGVSSDLCSDKLDPKAVLSGCVQHLGLFHTPL